MSRKLSGVMLLLTCALLAANLALLWRACAPVLAGPAASALSATILTVCPAGPPDCQYTSMQAAIDAAGPGDTIKVATGVYTDVQARPVPAGYGGPAVITQALFITRTISVRGGYTAPDFDAPPDPDAHPTTVDAQGRGRAVFVSGPISVTLEGLRLVGGSAAGLGGLRWPWHTDDAGGGLYGVTATLAISAGELVSGTAEYGGGAFVTGGDLDLRHSSVRSNSGGGIGLWQARATIADSDILANAGPGVYGRRSDTRIEDNTIAGNESSGGGGVKMEYGTVELVGNDIVGNSGNWSGGGVVYETGGLVQRNAIHDNTATSSYSGSAGGLVVVSTTLALENNVISGNSSAFNCGGLYVDSFGHERIEGNTIVSNTAENAGGGVWLAWNDAELRGNIIAYNRARYGAGVLMYQHRGVFEGNVADLDGGGLEVYYYTLTPIRRNTLVDNQAGHQGGGMIIDGGTYGITIENNIIAGNRAGQSGAGLFVLGELRWPARLAYNTIAHNLGGDGSGVFVWGAAVLTDTIVAGHGVGISITAGSVVTAEATMWGAGEWANGRDRAGEGTLVTGTVNVWGDPAFVSPDAGDYHLGVASAACDIGIDAGVGVDIDGDARPLGEGFDVGADEIWPGPALALDQAARPSPAAAGSALTFTLAVTNSGTVTLTAAITDALPAHVTPGGVLTWTPALLAPGQAWTAQAVVTAEAGFAGAVENRLVVSTAEGIGGTDALMVTVQVPVAGLEASSSSPTCLGQATTFTATLA